MMRMMKGRLPLALLGNDRLVQGAWCVGFADIPRFRLAVPTPNLIDPSQVAYRAEPPPTRCAVLASPPPGSSATRRALPIDTASPATSPRGGICGWVFYLRLECCILLRTRRSPNRRRHFSSFFLAHSFRISCIASISCTLAAARVLSLVPRRVHVHDACRFHLHPFRFIFQSPETSIKYVGSWGDPRPRRCCHRQPSGGLHRT